MSRKAKVRVPQEVREDKPENERKYKITGERWEDRVQTIRQVFQKAAECKEHFVTLDKQPHIQKYHTRLIEAGQLPVEILALRERFYWAGKKLKGYRSEDNKKAEVRTEEKIGKGFWQQVLKLGSDGTKTLKRGEHKRSLDGFGTNLSVYSDSIKEEALKILGKRNLKPLVQLQGQSIKLLYHPDGRKDMLFEIKFDIVAGRTFDGYERNIVEVEVEVKERGKKVTDKEIENMLDKSEGALLTDFADQLEVVYHSKVSELFQHLQGWLLRDPKGFSKAFDKLPGDKWAEYHPN